jgi:hypothetical protein
VAILAIAITFTACDKKGSGSVKLLESIDYDDDTYIKFEYDNKDRIVKMFHYRDGKVEFTRMVSYSSDDLITVEDVYSEDDANNKTIDFVKNENTITLKYRLYLRSEYVPPSTSITLNEDGYIKKETTAISAARTVIDTYRYRGNNLTEKTNVHKVENTVASSETKKYKYDDKKSPFYNCATPKWLMQYYIGSDLGFYNNVIDESGLDTYNKYKYDADGFPTKKTVKGRDGHEGNSTVFKYHGETETPADKTDDDDRDFVLTPYRVDEFASFISNPKEAKNKAYEYKADAKGKYYHFAGYVFGGDSPWDDMSYEEEFTASSTLAPKEDTRYDAANLRNGKEGGDRSVAWCEGVSGYGIGERVNMRITTVGHHNEDKIGFYELMIVNGYAKNKTAWKNNSRVKTLRFYVGDKHLYDLHLKDLIKPQVFRLGNLTIKPDKSGKKLAKSAEQMYAGYQTDLSFEIVEVYKGDKFDDTCITGIALDGYSNVY